jgi:hypothetical protein
VERGDRALEIEQAYQLGKLRKFETTERCGHNSSFSRV